jgi:hypothetical protein
MLASSYNQAKVRNEPVNDSTPFSTIAWGKRLQAIAGDRAHRGMLTITKCSERSFRAEG